MTSGVMVLMIGAGGHARVCLEALQDDPANTVVGAISSDGRGVEGLGVPVLGMTEDLHRLVMEHGIASFCVAIGDNAVRARVSLDLLAAQRPLTTAQSRHAVVSPTATVGPGSHLLPGSVINAATRIGTATIVNTNASVDHDGSIGDFVHIAPGVAIGGTVTIGDRAFVGIGARVLPGVTIGADAVIGGGAVVIDDVPPGAVVAGVPARLLRG